MSGGLETVLEGERNLLMRGLEIVLEGDLLKGMQGVQNGSEVVLKGEMTNVKGGMSEKSETEKSEKVLLMCDWVISLGKELTTALAVGGEPLMAAAYLPFPELRTEAFQLCLLHTR